MEKVLLSMGKCHIRLVLLRSFSSMVKIYKE